MALCSRRPEYIFIFLLLRDDTIRGVRSLGSRNKTIWFPYARGSSTSRRWLGVIGVPSYFSRILLVTRCMGLEMACGLRPAWVRPWSLATPLVVWWIAYEGIFAWKKEMNHNTVKKAKHICIGYLVVNDESLTCWTLKCYLFFDIIYNNVNV